MTSDSESVSYARDERLAAVAGRPATPLDADDAIPPSSQITIPSTEVPASPMDFRKSFKSEEPDEQIPSIIPSSQTPPPSSQMPPTRRSNGNHISTQSSIILSPPVTGLNVSLRRDAPAASEYSPPSPLEVVAAPPSELRAMLQECIAENARLKMETAHHKLQYNLASMQADEDAKRAAVEHEMTRREVEALRTVGHSRKARREIDAATESTQARLLQLTMLYDEAVEKYETLWLRLRAAKKIIHQKEEDMRALIEEKELLLNRLRENREHFHLLCSPGGIFHGALTPKTQPMSTPIQHRGTPKLTPRSAHRGHDRNHSQERMAALLQALSQEEQQRAVDAHHRPPTDCSRTDQALAKGTVYVVATDHPDDPARPGTLGALPSVDLVPQSEPQHRFIRYIPEKPTYVWELRPRSRESTISAEDNEELARQALKSVSEHAQTASFASQAPRVARGPPPHPSNENIEEEVFESQASQAASEMLRRDPRESFEVASSAGGSRDGTPGPAEKSAKLQAKIFAGLSKAVQGEKRKFNAGTDADEDVEQKTLASPAKKVRVDGALREGEAHPSVGLGIQYSQEA